ncbi:MAG: DUF4245 domain-containing protein, partial [Amnibacterium sp.]
GVSDKPPRVVAELGRPETPEETEARKAEGRRLRRQRQTARNLVYSLLVCVALVIVIVIAVPRGTPPAHPAIDYRTLAAQSQGSVDRPLLAPAVPSSWKANAAELRTADGVTSWYVGFVLPRDEFLSYTEGLAGNPTWLADVLESARPTGTTTVGGLTWRVYDRRGLGDAAGNVAYALSTRIGTTDLVVTGTATPAETRGLAADLAAEAASHHL